MGMVAAAVVDLRLFTIMVVVMVEELKLRNVNYKVIIIIIQLSCRFSCPKSSIQGSVIATLIC